MSISNQFVYQVFEHQKKELLLHLVEELPESEQVIVFVRAREETHAVATELLEAGEDVDSIHGKMKPEVRDATFQSFLNEDFRVLVATDATARALELSGIENVIHFDFAELEADYKQRAECSVAAGGKAIQLMHPKEVKMLDRLQKWVGCELPQERSEDFVYDKQAIPMKLAVRKGNKKSKADRSKPLQNKKKKYQKKKFGR